MKIRENTARNIEGRADFSDQTEVYQTLYVDAFFRNIDISRTKNNTTLF